MSVEGFEVLHYAIKSLGTSQSYQIIYFVEMTQNVIYFTINGKLVLSSKLRIRQNKFLVGSDWKYMKLTSHEALTAQIDQMLKMTLAPPGGHKELVKVR